MVLGYQIYHPPRLANKHAKDNTTTENAGISNSLFTFMSEN